MSRPLRHTPSFESVAPLPLRDGLTGNPQSRDPFNPFLDPYESADFIESDGGTTRSSHGHPLRYSYIAHYLGVSQDSVRRYSRLDCLQKRIYSNINGCVQALAERLPSHDAAFIRANASADRKHYLESRGLPADAIDELVKLYEIADKLEWTDPELNDIPAGHTQGETFGAAWIPYRFWDEFMECSTMPETCWMPKAQATLTYRISEHGLYDHAQPTCGRPLTTMTLGRHRLYRIDELDRRFQKR